MDDTFTDQLEEELVPLQRFALRLTHDRHNAEDLVQDCIERAIRKQHLWRPGTNLRAWVFRMMRNIYISGLRRGKTASNYLDHARAQIPHSTPGNQTDRLKVRDVGRSMTRLPAEQFETLLLSAGRGMRYDEIAETLAVPIGTVRSRLSRARAAMRESSGVAF